MNNLQPRNYSGALGSIEFGERSIGTPYQKTDIDYSTIRININLHDTAIYTLSAFKQWLIGWSVARYLFQHGNDITQFEQIINDLNFLTKYTKTSPITSPASSIRNKLDTLLHQDDHKELISYFTVLEESIQQVLHTAVSPARSNSLLSSEQFAYVYNQIHIDKKQQYNKHIQSAAKLFNLNPNLIKACIMVEQLRAFYTFKWLFKQIAKTNTYLTIMTKQSFGIGGMKLATAEQLENRIAKNNPEIYNQYFAYTNPNNINQQRLQRLTDSENYYYQIFYSAGLLYRYNQERTQQWYHIHDNPWLLATMYNIGYSDPHPNADIGGAFFTMEWDRYSFGGLAMLIYYYLEIFW